MQVSVTFRNIEPTEALKAYAADKLEHVKKVLIKPIEAHVILSVEKFRHRAEVTIVASGETLVGEEQSDDMYKSIDKVMDKVTRQARRAKEKARSHRGVKPMGEAAAMANALAAEDDFDDEGDWAEEDVH